jgi:hypothetical protein
MPQKFTFVIEASSKEDLERQLTDFRIAIKHPEYNKISCIKHIRAIAGLGLKEAKEAVEGMEHALVNGKLNLLAELESRTSYNRQRAIDQDSLLHLINKFETKFHKNSKTYDSKIVEFLDEQLAAR